MVILAGDAPGRDAYREELIGLIARRGLGDGVRLVGHCREMPAAYLAAQVAVTTSTVPETFGRTSAEAQAMGCPVIVPDLGALPETIFRRGRAKRGLVHRMALPATRCRGAGEPLGARARSPSEARDVIGFRARAHVAGKFMLERHARPTLAVYDELLGSVLCRIRQRVQSEG